MKWQEARATYPHQWLLVEALNATTIDGQRIIDELAIINQFEDGQDAWQAYATLHAQNPQREMLVLHTQREELDITVKQWVGLRGIV
jgi:hypothetical protein